MKARTVVLFILLVSNVASAQSEFVIGIVDGSPVYAQQLAAAVEAANVTAAVAAVEPHEGLAVAAHICSAGAVDAVLTLGGEARLAAAAASRAGVPLILAGPAPADIARDTLALQPPDALIAAATVDLCREKDWKHAVLLHEGSALPAALIAPEPEPLNLISRRLPPEDDDALLRNLLLVLKKAGATNFIVWCDAVCAERVLDAAQRVGLLAAKHSYIILAFELRTRPLEAFSHGGANITTFMLFDPASRRVQDAERAWRERYSTRVAPDSPPIEVVPAAMKLALDAAAVMSDVASTLKLRPIGAADCAKGRPAFHADTLLNYVRSQASRGVSGALMAWEAGGGRRGASLAVAELARGGELTVAGQWTAGDGVKWSRPPTVAAPVPAHTMLNRTFTVLIAMNKPYVMKRESDVRLSGNERYEGFCIELIERLAKHLGFNYTFVEQADGKYGNRDPDTGRWDGMLGRLMVDDDVHFAITDLTMTAERVEAVDFTTPFMTLGIAILFRTPRTPEPALFAFLLPFSAGVWVWLVLSYLGTSLLLFVVGRLCPAEWQNPYPCVEEPEALENQFTLANALWFNLGAVLLQGSEIAPVAYGTRAVASVWFLFALVITSSYTANLATLLAKKTSTQLINNVHDLANNSLGISYGAKAGGSTYTFFEHAQSELYKTMYQHMKDENMPLTNELGIKRVVESDYRYAFLMESTSIEYEVERNCDVTMVGDLLDSKGYGIAMKKNSPYRQPMNLALLRLQEKGVLREMKYTWWKEKHGGGACNQVEDYENTKLSMNNFRGLWLVLAVGCTLGMMVAIGDVMVRARREQRPPSAPYHMRLYRELRFVFRFDRSEKPVQGPLLTPTPTPSTSSASDYGGEEEMEEDYKGRRGTVATTGSGPTRRRRSSIQAANMNLARHASGQSSIRSHVRSPRNSIRSPRQSIRSPRQSIRSPRRSIRYRDQRSPHRDQGSPHRVHRDQGSPHRSQRSPHRSQRSPNRDQRSPHRDQGSPHRSQRSPNRDQRSTHRDQSSPHRSQCSPHRDQSSPHRSQRSPHRNQRSLRWNERSPQQHEHSPQRHERSSIKNDRSHRHERLTTPI